MGKKNGNKKGNNVRNVDPNFNALATGFTNRGPSTNETERKSSDSPSQSFADENPHGPSSQASNHQSSATRAHSSESTRTPDDPAIGGSESSVESGDSHSTSSSNTNSNPLGGSSNTGDQARAVDQHSHASGSAEASQAQQVPPNQRTLPAISTPSGIKSADREVTLTGHFTALTSALGTPRSTISRSAGLSPSQLRVGQAAEHQPFGRTNISGAKRSADDMGQSTGLFDNNNPLDVWFDWVASGRDRNARWLDVTGGDVQRAALYVRRRLAAYGYAEGDLMATQCLSLLFLT